MQLPPLHGHPLLQLGLCHLAEVPVRSHASGELGAAVMYALVTPTLNPFIDSLRNKDEESWLKSVLGIESSWH